MLHLFTDNQPVEPVCASYAECLWWSVNRRLEVSGGVWLRPSLSQLSASSACRVKGCSTRLRLSGLKSAPERRHLCTPSCAINPICGPETAPGAAARCASRSHQCFHHLILTRPRAWRRRRSLWGRSSSDGADEFIHAFLSFFWTWCGQFDTWRVRFLQNPVPCLQRLGNWL